jgi:FkbM family methyltransferase
VTDTQGNLLDDSLIVLRSQHARHPLRCRPDSSDPLVYRQIFIGREYACLDDVTEAGLVIDCGANVGYSAAYFLTRFPGCDLIAVEPDASNFQLLCRNLAPYGERAHAIHSAVWSHPARLTISETPYRGGWAWTRQVRECKPGEAGGFLAVDLGGLLSRSGHQRISILKMDVEGAEAVIFSANVEPWIDRVDNLVIELHDDSIFGVASAVFASAIAGRGFAVSRHKELTVCKRGSP